MQIVGHRCMHFDHWLIFLWADYEFACYHERLYRSHVARSFNKVNGWKLIRDTIIWLWLFGEPDFLLLQGTHFECNSLLFRIHYYFRIIHLERWSLFSCSSTVRCTFTQPYCFCQAYCIAREIRLAFFPVRESVDVTSSLSLYLFFSAEPAELWAFARNTQIACIYIGSTSKWRAGAL